MTIHLGNVDASSTLYIPFCTYNSAGASVTLTGLAVTDIELYRNGSVTQRSSDAGYALLDTDGIDFDAITGLHGFSIDLADNTDAGFYAAGSFYWVVVSTVTVDSQTVTFLAATFRIGPAAANVTQFGGTAGTFASGVPEVKTASLGNTAKSDVNAEVLDVLAVDTFAEPSQGAPPATTTLAVRLRWLYAAFRNLSTSTASEYRLLADDETTVISKAPLSDDGVTYSKGEVVTGA